MSVQELTIPNDYYLYLNGTINGIIPSAELNSLTYQSNASSSSTTGAATITLSQQSNNIVLINVLYDVSALILNNGVSEIFFQSVLLPLWARPITNRIGGFGVLLCNGTLRQAYINVYTVGAVSIKFDGGSGVGDAFKCVGASGIYTLN